VTARARRARSSALLLAIVAIGLALRLALLPRVAFHTDEYRSLHRALAVANGDLFLDGDPSQKPPLFYMLLAAIFGFTGPSVTAALLPDLVASLASIPLACGIARWLYADEATALLAAWFTSTSLFAVLFAPTILLDPFMVLLLLAAWWAALAGRPGWSGVLAGLACATKQQAIVSLPLVAATVLLFEPAPGTAAARIGAWRSAVRWASGLAAPLAALLAWGLGSARAPLFFVGGQIENERRAIGAPLLVLPWRDGVAELSGRIAGWGRVVAPVLADPWVTALAAVGLLCVAAFASRSTDVAGARGAGASVADAVLASRRRRADVLVAAGIAVHFATLVFVRFRYIDRYVLPLAPLLAIALARTVASAARFVAGAPRGAGANATDGREPARRVLAAALVAVLVAAPLVAFARRSQVARIADRPGVGALYDGRTALRPTLARLAGELAPADEIYCDLFTYPAAAFFLAPRRVRELTADGLADLARDPAASAGGSRIVVWSAELPLKPVRDRLAGRFALVALERPPGLLVFRADPIRDPTAGAG